MMKLIGKEPINPALFYSGKIAGYAIWIALLVEIIHVPAITELSISKQLAIFLTLISIVLIAVSLINLLSLSAILFIGNTKCMFPNCCIAADGQKYAT